jgi:hypothetical protein
MDWGILIPIVAIMMGISIPITAIKLKHREKIEQMRLAAGHSNNHDGARAAQRDAKIELLEDRIAVLERIVTDRGYDLATQIEALRDLRPDNGVPLGSVRQKEGQR